MKTLTKLFLVVLIAITAVSCQDKAQTEAEKATSDFNQYVDSMNRANLDYTNENWASIETGYRMRAEKAEAQLAKMNDSQKSNYEASKKKYADLSTRYKMEIEKKYPVIDSRVVLRNSLFGEGRVGDDMSFGFANAGNLLSIYDTFYNALQANKDVYSREDWDEIKVLYEALDTRKNEVEKELVGSDNSKIANLKVKIGTMLELQRPGSKVKENSDAKK
ncbi:MAG: hypothetical protein SGI87_06430 [Flavobacteriales bacterium]|nr:hypothetical protein [Flavobacteriales bacterium]